MKTDEIISDFKQYERGNNILQSKDCYKKGDIIVYNNLLYDFGYFSPNQFGFGFYHRFFQ